MATLGTLLPILHEADWSGVTLAACRPLVQAEGEYLPLVAFAEDSAERRSTWTVAALDDAGKTLEALEAEAAGNLARRAIGLRERADGSIVAIDEYATSILASPSELERARVAAGATSILLAAPTRGLLVVVARPAEGDAGLSRFARETFASALEARITPHVFAWDGETLSVHVETVPEPTRGTWEELDYDEEAEMLTLALRGPLGPAAVRDLRRILANGRHPDGRVVSSFTLEVSSEAHVLELESAFSPGDVEARLATAGEREKSS